MWKKQKKLQTLWLSAPVAKHNPIRGFNVAAPSLSSKIKEKLQEGRAEDLPF